MNFEYFRQVTTLDSIDIPDMGNVCLNALNDEGKEWYLLIETHLGESVVKQYGPLLADVDLVQGFFQYTYFKMTYKESKLYNTIDKFINPPKENITQVFFSSKEVFEERLSKLKE